METTKDYQRHSPMSAQREKDSLSPEVTAKTAATEGSSDQSIPFVSPGRLVGIIVFVALIMFSSTKAAGDASEFAYNFYQSGLQLPTGGGDSILHLLADKYIHILLFFSLGC
jgi:hypothetical protein